MKLKRILIRLIALSITVSLSSLIRFLEQWMHLIQECLHLAVVRPNANTIIMISSSRRSVVLLEHLIATIIQIRIRLSEMSRMSGYRSRGRLLRPAMITNTKRRHPLRMMLVDTKYPWTLISKKKISLQKLRKSINWIRSNFQASSLIKMRWVHPCTKLKTLAWSSHSNRSLQVLEDSSTMRWTCSQRSKRVWIRRGVAMIRGGQIMIVVKRLGIGPKPVRSWEIDNNLLRPPIRTNLRQRLIHHCQVSRQ